MNIIIMIMTKNGVETVKSVVIVNIIKLLDRPWLSNGRIIVLSTLIFRCEGMKLKNNDMEMILF